MDQCLKYRLLFLRMHFWACLSNSVVQINFTLRGFVGMLTDSMTKWSFIGSGVSLGSERLREELVNGLWRLSSQITGSNLEPAWQWMEIIASWQEPDGGRDLLAPIPAASSERSDNMAGGYCGVNENTGADPPGFFLNSLSLTRLNTSINLVGNGWPKDSSTYLFFFFFCCLGIHTTVIYLYPNYDFLNWGMIDI